LNINSKFETQNHDNSSFDNFNSESEEKNYTPIDSMIHNFLEVLKIMDYDNTIYYIAPGKHFHPLSLFKDKHLEEQNFPTLFYGHPRYFFESFSYQQIVQWELLHKSRDFSTNISNHFSKLLKFPSKK
jgi:hypothetical protein